MFSYPIIKFNRDIYIYFISKQNQHNIKNNAYNNILKKNAIL